MSRSLFKEKNLHPLRGKAAKVRTRHIEHPVKKKGLCGSDDPFVVGGTLELSLVVPQEHLHCR
jgi:hypothetical protein